MYVLENKKIVFLIKFHWLIFVRFQLIISQHWFWWWLGSEQAISHYVNRWWPIALTHICVARLQCSNAGIEYINSLGPWQNGLQFADDIFNYISLYENVWIPIKISPTFVPKDPINNISALVQIMAWRRLGDKPFYEPMMVSLPTRICVTRPRLKMQRTLSPHHIFILYPCDRPPYMMPVSRSWNVSTSC